jgi:hypothetical protein
VLLFSLSHAFDANDYLYSNETGATINATDFNVNGTSYSLISINGEESFLISNNAPVENKSTIETVLHDYYLETYYPSESELDNVWDLLDSYNASRNDGNKFKNKEEYVCRDVIFSNGRVKSGKNPVECTPALDNCNLSAMFLYSYLSSATGNPPTGSWTDLIQPIKDFSYPSYYTDQILNNASAKLNSTNSEDVYDGLEYINDQISNLKTHASNIEATMFGWLWKETTKSWTIDSKHWAICPPLDLDQSILDDLSSETSKLTSKMAPYAGYKTVSSNVYSSTSARLIYKSETENMTYYNSKFLPLAQNGTKVIEFGDMALKKISNSTVSSDFSKLKSLHNSINSSIQNKQFSTLDADLAEYESLIPKVNKSLHEIYAIYNISLSAKNQADSLIFILDTKEVDPLTRGEIEKLKNRTTDMDMSFKDGLDADQYVSFAANYSNIANDAKTILRKTRETPGSMMFLSFRSFARRVNDGLATFVESSDIMNPKEVTENKALTFGGFSFITLLSIGAICLLVFLAIIFRNNLLGTSIRYILVFLFVSAIFSLTAFSVFLFFYLDRTSTDADVEEFLIDLDEKENIGILVDLTNAPYGAKNSMTSCASTLASNYAKKNKTISLYQLETSGCAVTKLTNSTNSSSTLATSECLQEIDNQSSSIILNYSSSLEKPKFSIIYTSRADISADSSYYGSCPLKFIFS